MSVMVALWYCTLFFFFFKHKTALQVDFCDWGSHVCSSDLAPPPPPPSPLPSPSRYLDYDGLDVAHARLGGDVPPHGPPRLAHRRQDLRVGGGDDGAGQRVAAHEQRHGVGAGARVQAGDAPVDAARRAVGLGPVGPPVGERGAREHQGVGPGTADQDAPVVGAEAVTWEGEAWGGG